MPRRQKERKKHFDTNRKSTGGNRWTFALLAQKKGKWTGVRKGFLSTMFSSSDKIKDKKILLRTMDGSFQDKGNSSSGYWFSFSGLWIRWFLQDWMWSSKDFGRTFSGFGYLLLADTKM